jgi:hypothetical protein
LNATLDLVNRENVLNVGHRASRSLKNEEMQTFILESLKTPGAFYRSSKEIQGSCRSGMSSAGYAYEGQAKIAFKCERRPG